MTAQSFEELLNELEQKCSADPATAGAFTNFVDALTDIAEKMLELQNREANNG